MTVEENACLCEEAQGVQGDVGIIVSRSSCMELDCGCNDVLDIVCCERKGAPAFPALSACACRCAMGSVVTEEECNGRDKHWFLRNI